MNRYLVLDLEQREDALYFADKFLKDSRKWNQELKQHLAELDCVTDLSAVVNSEVHTGHISHPTEYSAMDRINITMKIDRLKNYQKLLEVGLSSLNEDEKKVIDAFYFTEGRYINSLVHDLAYEFECSTKSIYNKKNKALLDIANAIMVYINY